MLLFYQSTFTMHHCIPVSLFCFHLCLRDTSINFYTCWQICSLSAARLSLPSDSKHDGSERFVRLKVWSKNSRLRKKSWRIFVWAGLSGRKRRRFHADCILRLVLETKTGSSRSRRETEKKGKNKNKKNIPLSQLKLDSWCAWVWQMHWDRNEKQLSFLTFRNVFTNEDYSANSLGKMFQQATDHAMQSNMNTE